MPSREAIRVTVGDHRFFSTMAIVSTLAIAGGFANTYGPKVVSGAPVPTIIHVHAGVFAAWLVVNVLQTGLIRNGRPAVHRRLGTAAMGLAALMIVVGTMTAITVARRGDKGIPGVEMADAEGFLLLNLAALVVFGVLVAAGYVWRREPQVHKRLMLMATMGALVGPGVSRLPGLSGHEGPIAATVLVFLLAGPLYDFATRHRVHPVYFAALAVSLINIPPINAALGATRTWHNVASWLIR